MEVISVNNTTYASGGRRLLAWFIDRIIISSVLSFFITWSFIPHDDFKEFFDIRFLTLSFGIYQISKFIIGTLYYAVMESSKHQATLGKLAVGVKVTDQNGQRLTFSKALLRNLSKIISGWLLGIGYIMIIFDERKQGLHDKIADSYVVRN